MFCDTVSALYMRGLSATAGRMSAVAHAARPRPDRPRPGPTALPAARSHPDRPHVRRLGPGAAGHRADGALYGHQGPHPEGLPDDPPNTSNGSSKTASGRSFSGRRTARSLRDRSGEICLAGAFGRSSSATPTSAGPWKLATNRTGVPAQTRTRSGLGTGTPGRGCKTCGDGSNWSRPCR